MNVVNISIPPLRNRLDDIPLLTEKFLESTTNGLGGSLDIGGRRAGAGSANTITRAMCGSWKHHHAVYIHGRPGTRAEGKLLQMPMQIRAIGADAEKMGQKGAS